MEKNYSGILIVNKPKGMTSRDVVNKLTRILHTKKIGHTGTLDPNASGILICTIGKCTKLCDFLTSMYKEYHAVMKIGYETDTLDETGQILKLSNKKVSTQEIFDGIKKFIGVYSQEVPKYSAVKINGKKLYEYARNNEDISLPSREVDIKNISNIEIRKDVISFDCIVSKGTYIRSLIRDIGIYLGTYATMIDLVRIKQGEYDIRNSYSLDSIEKDNFQLLTVEEVLKNVYTINCDNKLYKEISNGVVQKYDLDEEYIAFKYNDKIIALYRKDDEKFRTYVMF